MSSSMFNPEQDIYNKPDEFLADKLRIDLQEAFLTYSNGGCTEEAYSDKKTEILSEILRSVLNQSKPAFVKSFEELKEVKTINDEDFKLGMHMYESREKVANLLNQEVVDMYINTDDMNPACLAEMYFRQMSLEDINSAIRQKSYLTIPLDELVVLANKGDTAAQAVLSKKNLTAEQKALLSVAGTVNKFKSEASNFLDNSGVKSFAEENVKKASGLIKGLFGKKNKNE